MLRTPRAQFALLVVSTLFVGGMVGLERSVLPLLAEREFGVASTAAALGFIATFGVAKAATNLFAGALADRVGRRAVLVAGWLVGLPVPLVVLTADRWEWIVAANVLLGLNQGMTWSMTINMKIDIAGPARRGVATGLNEAAGYVGVALLAGASAAVAARWGLRAPSWLGVAVALSGLALALFARETRPEGSGLGAGPDGRGPGRASAEAGSGAGSGGLRAAFRASAGGDRVLGAASFAGLATNLKDGVLWGLLPIALAARGFGLGTIGLVAAAYPAAWGLAQLATGPASDRLGRRPLVVAGLGVQAAGVVGLAYAQQPATALAAAIVAGLGTALAYPTLQAHVADLVAPRARASALGAYRFWRDGGYVAGALVA
ncbi:MAG TPA: MFS transporter, partial [Candidatus Thermoplasmatota archaeon]|nr:MFS transporter [Candidatus Thermoplasmatota archaeon]